MRNDSAVMHYRELTVWKKAMAAAVEVYRLVPMIPREESYGMRSQLTRAAVSVPANTAERWTRETSREKAHPLPVAQGSVAETETLLTLCEQIGWFPVADTVELRSLVAEVGKMLSAMRHKLRDSH